MNRLLVTFLSFWFFCSDMNGMNDEKPYYSKLKDINTDVQIITYVAHRFPWRYRLSEGWKHASLYCSKKVTKDNSWKAFLLRKTVQEDYTCHVTYNDGLTSADYDQKVGPDFEARFRDARMLQNQSYCGMYFHELKKAYKKQEELKKSNENSEGNHE